MSVNSVTVHASDIKVIVRGKTPRTKRAKTSLPPKAGSKNKICVGNLNCY